MGNEMLILMRSVEAIGRHKHARDGLIARTPGVEPEEAARRVEEYAAAKVREALDRIERVMGDNKAEPDKDGYYPDPAESPYSEEVADEIAAIRNELEEEPNG